jgi:hypothetical protein
VELTVTGTPNEVASIVTQANAAGCPVDVMPVGGGRLLVTVVDAPSPARPAREHTPQPQGGTASAVATRPLLPRILWIAGGTGAIAVAGGVVVLLLLDPAMLAIIAVLAVLGLIAISGAVASVKSAFKGD